jgi:putative chitinase
VANKIPACFEVFMAQPTAPEVAAPITRLTHEVYRLIMPKAPANYLDPLRTAMVRFHITTPKRIAAFLSQIAVESNQLNRTREMWTPRKDFHLPGVHRPKFTAKTQEEYFEHWYGGRLGNTNHGDGFKYRGRGAIQITGKANYTAIGKGIGKPLADQPDLLATDPLTNMLASAYFFAVEKHLLHTSDQVEPEKDHSVTKINGRLTHAVNGGSNGIDERLENYKKALFHLGELPLTFTSRPSTML